MTDSGNIVDVDYVAKLARLELPADVVVRENLQHDLQAVVQYIELLKELNVDGIEPTAHAVASTNVDREDVAGELFDRDLLLQNAPARINGDLVKVSQVLPGEGMN